MWWASTSLKQMEKSTSVKIQVLISTRSSAKMQTIHSKWGKKKKDNIAILLVLFPNSAGNIRRWVKVLSVLIDDVCILYYFEQPEYLCSRMSWKYETLRTDWSQTLLPAVYLKNHTGFADDDFLRWNLLRLQAAWLRTRITDSRNSRCYDNVGTKPRSTHAHYFG